MRTLTWALRGILFVALFLFALKNTDLVSLRFYFDQVWQAPLILVLLVFFAAGAATGVLACMATVFGYRRDLMKLRRELRSRGHADAAQVPAGDPGVDRFPGI